MGIPGIVTEADANRPALQCSGTFMSQRSAMQTCPNSNIVFAVKALGYTYTIVS